MILEMKMKKLVGIDYSLTSPAICVTDDFKFEYSHFYFLTNKKNTYKGKKLYDYIMPRN